MFEYLLLRDTWKQKTFNLQSLTSMDMWHMNGRLSNISIALFKSAGGGGYQKYHCTVGRLHLGNIDYNTNHVIVLNFIIW